MNYKSVGDLDRDLVAWLPKLPRDIEVVAGIPRSGMLVATILALHMNLPMTDLEGLVQGRLIASGMHKKTSWNSEDFLLSPRRVLLLDDSVLSGREMKRARGVLSAGNCIHRVSFAAPYIVPTIGWAVDFHYQELPSPRIFEWNLMQAQFLADACVDIDGVLCEDPTEEQNDDGTKYLEFLRTALPKIIPTGRIHQLVTSRLEKYRPQTVAWLEGEEIKYDELVMLDLPDKETRLRLAVHGSFKAEVFKKSRATIFIESNRGQAMEIARRSGKWSICIETAECFAPGGIAESAHDARNALAVLRHRPRQFAARIYRRFFPRR